jgi:hypothetical protein
MARKRTADARDDEALAADVHEAMVQAGWTVPTAPEDVAAAETQLAGKRIPLPEALREPGAVFERPDTEAGGEARRIPFPGSADIDATLARAAREAGRLTPEVEEAMRRDREAAERELDDAEEQA